MRTIEDVRQLDRLSEDISRAFVRRLRDFVRRSGYYNSRFGFHGVRISDIRRALLPLLDEASRKTVRRSLEANRKLLVFRLGEPMEAELRREVFTNYSASLSRLEGRIRDKISKLVRRAVYENWTQEELENKIKREIKQLAESRVKTLVRTELQNIFLRAREKIGERFEKRTGRKVMYEWKTTHDSRVCDICRSIERRTRGGVTIEELKRIVREEVTRHGGNYNPARPFTPHPNDRCVYVPVGFK